MKESLQIHCLTCGKKFEATTALVRFCAPKCFSKHRNYWTSGFRQAYYARYYQVLKMDKERYQAKLLRDKEARKRCLARQKQKEEERRRQFLNTKS